MKTDRPEVKSMTWTKGLPLARRVHRRAGIVAGGVAGVIVLGFVIVIAAGRWESACIRESRTAYLRAYYAQVPDRADYAAARYCALHNRPYRADADGLARIGTQAPAD